MENNCKIVFRFFRKYFFHRILFLSLFPFFTFAQDHAISYDSLNYLLSNKKNESSEPSVESGGEKKWKVSFLYSIIKMKDIDDLNGYIEADKLFKGSTNSRGVSFKFEYSVNKDWNLGIDCFFWKEDFQTKKYYGSETVPAQIFGIIPEYTIDYYDLVFVEYKSSSIGAFASYKLLHYSKSKRQPFEISIRSGINYEYLTVTQELAVAEYKKHSTSYNNKSGAHKFVNSSGFTGMAALQLTCRVNRSISIVLFDFADYFKFDTSEIPEISASCENGKTITLKKHPVNPACLSYSFGLALHF